MYIWRYQFLDRKKKIQGCFKVICLVEFDIFEKKNKAQPSDNIGFGPSLSLLSKSGSRGPSIYLFIYFSNKI